MKNVEISSYPTALPMESPISMLDRFMSLHGHTSMRPLELTLGCEYNRALYPHLIGNTQLFKALIKSPKLKTMELESTLFRLSGLTRRASAITYGCEVPQKSIDRKYPRICSECIAKDGYYTTLAHLNFLPYCPIHNRELLNTCSACGNPKHWYNALKACTQCGHAEKKNASARVESRYARILSNKFQLKQVTFFTDFFTLLKAIDYPVHKMLYQRVELLDICIHLLIDPKKAINDFVNFSRSHYRLTVTRVILAPLLECGISRIEEASLEYLQSQQTHAYSALSEGTESTNRFYDSNQARVALNISLTALKKLSICGLIEIQTPRKKLWSALEINTLLEGLKTVKIQSTRHRDIFIGGKRRFSERLKQLSYGVLPVCEANLKLGLRGIYVDAPSVEKKGKVSHELLNIHQASELLKTHCDAIRRAVKSGFITFNIKRESDISPYLFRKKDVDIFRKNYIFSKELASQLNYSGKFINSMMISVNILPVSGPTVDGGLAHIYNRDQCKKLEFEDILANKVRASRLGRRKNDTPRYDRLLWVESSEVSRYFNTTGKIVSKMYAQGYLSSGMPEGRHDNINYYSRKSFDRLKDLERRHISLKEFCERLKRSKNYIQRVFVRTGHLKPFHIGITMYFRQVDIEKAKAVTSQYMTPAEAAEYVCQPKYFFQNQVKSGLLNYVTPQECRISRHVRLLRISDIEVFKRKQQLTLNHRYAQKGI